MLLASETLRRAKASTSIFQGTFPLPGHPAKIKSLWKLKGAPRHRGLIHQGQEHPERCGSPQHFALEAADDLEIQSGSWGPAAPHRAWTLSVGAQRRHLALFSFKYPICHSKGIPGFHPTSSSAPGCSGSTPEPRVPRMGEGWAPPCPASPLHHSRCEIFCLRTRERGENI